MWTSSSRLWAVAGVLYILSVGSVARAADEPPKPKIPVEKEYPWDKQAGAYRELFEKVGRAGLPDLMKDKDTGIALHAAWEVHKKLVRSPKPVTPFANRSGETYDPKGMKKFVAFLKDRTKAPVPGWWADGLADLEVWKGAGHRYQGTELKLKEVKLGKDVWRVRDGVELALKDGIVSYRSGDVALDIPDRLLRFAFEDTLADLTVEKVTCLAGYRAVGGFRFKLVGFENKSSKHIWSIDVWAIARRGLIGSSCRHRVEVTRASDTVFVFGAEARGMYAEAFDLETGKCRFRFCTSYWNNPSEAWKFNRGG